MLKIAFFGHPGSFTEAAAHEYIRIQKLSEFLLVPCISIKEVFSVVQSGEDFVGVVPMSNTHSGIVKDFGKIIGKHNIEHVKEIQMGIVQNVLGLPGDIIFPDARVYSHPHALTQCSKFLSNFRLIPCEYSSTSSAARDLSLNRFKSNSLVIGHVGLAKLYKLQILESGIENEPTATTFLVFE